jgi:hypothetical protein
MFLYTRPNDWFFLVEKEGVFRGVWAYSLNVIHVKLKLTYDWRQTILIWYTTKRWILLKLIYVTHASKGLT